MFTWSVITPEGNAATGECEFLVAPTTGGELGVLAEHAPLIASVVPGDLRVASGATVRTVRLGAGVIEVRDNRVRLLVTHAVEGGISDSPAPA
jgi:F-type H+-transporting ATPase subunit epsilon